MSFRTRLTSFFAVIVVLPMVAIGVLVLRLISDSEQGKADARANGLATAAASLYENESATGRADAQAFAEAHGLFVGRIDARRVTALASRAGLARVTLTAGSRMLADVGDRTAIAPGSAMVGLGAGRTPITVTVSKLTARQFGRDLAAPDVAVVVRQAGRTLNSTLGEEFNNMSRQLARRLDELSQERGRLRESIRRIGDTFAANLDRPALLDLALETAMDAVQAVCGRLSVCSSPDEPLVEAVREGSLDGFEGGILEAERAALTAGGLGERTTEQTSIVSVSLGPLEPDRRLHGVITVARRDRPFSDEDRELLRSLATQATLALENVELHMQVSRQAVTDELTGLANHGQFQEQLGAEMEQVRRYEYPIGLIMLDIDDFKSINDTYGHQQGDLVLRQVAHVLRENSRDADSPARYGGEEMALILPYTDLEGSYAIAERVRAAIEGLRIPRSDHQGVLRITASVGVAAATDGRKESLVADADAALYDAKRRGKNCTISAPARATNASGAE
jgi:diguanylate cyclase (GGDEF)-like protein